MKKTLYAAVLFLTIGIAATSCKKENNANIENPIKKVISEKIILDSSRLFSNNTWEFGEKIYFSRNGKVTKLGCMMGNKGNFRVSFWDAATKNLLAATTINVTDTTKFIYNSISPIDVTANTRYVISLNNTSGGTQKLYYLFSKKDESPIFPFTSGSVTYEAHHETNSATSVFPLPSFSNEYIAGVPDLQFEYEE
ncbi:MAG TPA: DUF4082 domain-containing protein [Chitinophagales bacterium]|nr:DUF4082 domain-containing protein [Chitinophagales bacterium]HQW79716.1 DUF4082 domain-containing protein [Chitinophagales bacterium]HRB66371.1 DUF4082 domain-containing protein [Chitinophagales bacterium]HRB68487.1 DUF4082 domain-containing protein [Chitinophagales bacterium]